METRDAAELAAKIDERLSAIEVLLAGLASSRAGLLDRVERAMTRFGESSVGGAKVFHAADTRVPDDIRAVTARALHRAGQPGLTEAELAALRAGEPAASWAGPYLDRLAAWARVDPESLLQGLGWPRPRDGSPPSAG